MTNSFNELKFDSILENLSATSRKQVFKNLSDHISNMIGVSEKLLFDQLTKNESKQSSGIGHGIAIPHLRLPRLTKPMNIVMRVPQGIDFESHDSELVDIICLVLSPEFEGTRHLSRLSSVTRCFRNQEFLSNLNRATSSDEMRYAIQTINEQKIAA